MLLGNQLLKTGAESVVPLSILALLDYELIFDRLDSHNLRHFKVKAKRKKIIFDCNLKLVFLHKCQVPIDYSCSLCKKENSKKKPKIGKSFQRESLHIINFHKNYFPINELISNVQYLEWKSLSQQGFNWDLLSKEIKN